jgi:hypothetical protein
VNVGSRGAAAIATASGAASPHRRVLSVAAIRRVAAAEWLFAGVVAMTAWWYMRSSRGQSFLRDDWRVATRSLSLGDLFEPHNGHLSVVPLAIYRVLLGEFGLHTYTPYRVLGSTSLLCLGVALFLLARGRVGAPLALVVAVSVLWLPMMGLTPFMANYRVSLLCGVVCAAAMPSTDRRSDVVVGTALAVGLASSGVGMALAAACAVHAVVFRPLDGRRRAEPPVGAVVAHVGQRNPFGPEPYDPLRPRRRGGRRLQLVRCSDKGLVGGRRGPPDRLGGPARPPGEDRSGVGPHPACLGGGPRDLVGRPRMVATGSGRLLRHPSLQVRRCRVDPPLRAAGGSLGIAPDRSGPVAYDRSRVGGHWGHHPCQPRRPVARRAREGGGSGESRDGPVRVGADSRADRADASADPRARSDHRARLRAGGGPLRLAHRHPPLARRSVDRTSQPPSAHRGLGTGQWPSVRSTRGEPAPRRRGNPPHRGPAGDGQGAPVRVRDV